MSKVVAIGEVPWTRDDLLAALGEFEALYMERPIRDNVGGMKAPHMFAVWFMARVLAPKLVVESGVWKGQSTWILERACHDAKIVSIDLDLSRRKYVSNRVEYSNRDFTEHDWSGVKPEESLAFFDDHQNAYFRLQQCHWVGFRHVIFEDNYPPCQGDCYSLKKAFAGTGFEPLPGDDQPVSRHPLADFRKWIANCCGVVVFGGVGLLDGRNRLGYSPLRMKPHRAAFVEACARELPLREARIVELGCDFLGEIGAALTELYGASDFVGFNPAWPDMRWGPKARRLRDASGLPDASFDLVLSLATLEHVHDLAGFFRQTGRLLRPGGIFFTTFGPVYSGYAGHHLWLKKPDRHYTYEWIDLPDFCHLLMSRQEILARLQADYRFAPELAEEIADYVVASPEQNSRRRARLRPSHAGQRPAPGAPGEPPGPARRAALGSAGLPDLAAPRCRSPRRP